MRATEMRALRRLDASTVALLADATAPAMSAGDGWIYLETHS